MEFEEYGEYGSRPSFAFLKLLLWTSHFFCDRIKKDDWASVRVVVASHLSFHPLFPL